MRKFLAVVKREYVQRVRSRLFIASTLLGPFVMALFGVVPALIFSIDARAPPHIAVVDQTGRMYSQVKAALTEASKEGKSKNVNTEEALNANREERLNQLAESQLNTFSLEEVNIAGRTIDDLKRELNQRISQRN